MFTKHTTILATLLLVTAPFLHGMEEYVTETKITYEKDVPQHYMETKILVCMDDIPISETTIKESIEAVVAGGSSTHRTNTNLSPEKSKKIKAEDNFACNNLNIHTGEEKTMKRFLEYYDKKKIMEKEEMKLFLEYYNIKKIMEKEKKDDAERKKIEKENAESIQKYSVIHTGEEETMKRFLEYYDKKKIPKKEKKDDAERKKIEKEKKEEKTNYLNEKMKLRL